MGFAISVASGVDQENLQLIKETVHEMIDRHGVGRVRYGFIVFGSSAVIRIPFSDRVRDSAELKKAVDDRLISTTTSPNLDAVLEKAEMLFNGSKRSQAKKILILVVDRKSANDPSSVKVRYSHFFLSWRWSCNYKYLQPSLNFLFPYFLDKSKKTCVSRRDSDSGYNRKKREKRRCETNYRRRRSHCTCETN